MSDMTQTGRYSISGVVVRTRVDDVSTVATRLATLPAVDVHHLEASTGRIVITLEIGGGDDEAETLRRVREESGVLSAELVCHYVEPPGGDAAPAAGFTRGAV
jgi:nitrate reductase NapAB chaperone NapD